MARKWFSCFKEDRFDVSDTPCSGKVMNCDHYNIVRHLHSTSKVKKSGVWIPYPLSQNHKNQPVAICAPTFARHRLARENVDYSSPISLLVTINGVFMLHREKKGMVEPKQEKNVSEMFEFLHLSTPFSSVHGSTHYLQMTKLKYINSSTTIELQIKMTIDK